MDFLDYREKLGVGFYDKDKFNYFLIKIFNVLNVVSEQTYSGCVQSNDSLRKDLLRLSSFLFFI